MGLFDDPRETNNGVIDHFGGYTDEANRWIYHIYGSYNAYFKSLQRSRKFVRSANGWISIKR